MTRKVNYSLGCAIVAACLSVDALAISLPASGTTNVNGTALKLTNTNQGSFAYAIEAEGGGTGLDGGIGIQAVGTGEALYATGDGYGVRATGQTAGLQGTGSIGNGVEGDTGTPQASGVYGFNSSTGGFGVAGRLAANATGGAAVLGDAKGSPGLAAYFRGDVTVTGVFHSSDARLKTNIKPLSSPLEQLLKLHGVSFEWISPPANEHGTQIGFIAQDIEKVYPQWVTTDPDGFKAVNTRGVQALLVEGMRTLKSDDDALEKQLVGLERSSGRVAGVKRQRPWASLFGLASMGVALVVFRRRK